jgi:hypothetical protein
MRKLGLELGAAFLYGLLSDTPAFGSNLRQIKGFTL